MARSQSSGIFKFIGAAAAAIIGGVTIGYLVGNARSPHSGDQAVQPTPAVISTPAPSVAPPILHPRPTNGDYTAPDAPRIAIREESAPILHRVTQPAPAPPADTEANQEAQPPPPPLHKTGDTSSPLSAASTGSDTVAPPQKPSDTPPPTPDSGASAPPAPADPDFERVGKAAPDPESSQEGGGKAQFRVQTGSYTDESNARSVADELRGQGYTTSTRSEREGDRMIYKVQVGAFHTKNGAGKAAEELQKKGYPAYVSPISP